MTNGKKEFRIRLEIRNENFEKIDEKTFSGRSAIVDCMYYLDTKYSPSPIEFLKRFW